MAIIDRNLNILKSLIKSPEVAEKIIDHIKSCALNITQIKTMGSNKTSLTGEVFSIEQAFKSLPITETVFEAHRKYVDIQYMLEGYEIFGLENIEKLMPKIEYSSERDFIAYHTPENFTELKLATGWFAIYFPWDSHLCAWNKESAYTGVKVVIKVPLELFNNPVTCA